MSIVRYENIDLNNVTNSVSDIGEQTTTITLWFTTRALVADVTNSLRISEKYRIYGDLINLTVNYTSNTKTIAINQQDYSITWRGQEWRIADIKESNDRQKVTFICYRNDPIVPV